MSSDNEITLTKAQVIATRQAFRYCPQCGLAMTDRQAYGRVRRVCPDDTCRFVQFIDPKVGVGVLVGQKGQVLLVKRRQEPAIGAWCLPGGFMESGETPQQAAQRECYEETGVEVKVTNLLDVYYYENYRGSGVMIIYEGVFVGGTLQASDDASEANFFPADALPDKMAFADNVTTIEKWINDRRHKTIS